MGVSSCLNFYHSHVGELAAVVMAFCATLSVLAWTSTGRRIGVVAVGCIRLAAASVLLAIWGAATRGLWLPIDVDSHTWMILVISGVLGYFLSDLLAIKAFMVVGPRLALLLQSLSPPLVTVLGYYYCGEKLGAVNAVGMAVTLAGVVWVVFERPESHKEEHRRKDFAWGVVVGIGSAVFGGVATLFASIGVKHVDPMAATQIRILAALLCYPLLLTYLRRWWQIERGIRNLQAMKILLFGTIVGPFVGMGLYMYALKVCPMGIVNTISCTTPVLILPFSILVYKEKVSPRAAVGAVVSVLGVMLLMYKPISADGHRAAIAPPPPAATASIGLDHANAVPFERGEDRAVRGGIGDERGPIGKPAESPERGLAQLRAVGDDEYAPGRRGHLREHAREFR
jgi:drug/metabolite transporter (DMT)-like permease